MFLLCSCYNPTDTAQAAPPQLQQRWPQDPSKEPQGLCDGTQGTRNRAETFGFYCLSPLLPKSTAGNAKREHSRMQESASRCETTCLVHIHSSIFVTTCRTCFAFSLLHDACVRRCANMHKYVYDEQAEKGNISTTYLCCV